MKCESKKVVGKRWSMRYEYTSDIMAPCTNTARYILQLSNVGKYNKKETKYVCGIHKNSIIRHGKQVGYMVVSKLLA